MIRERHPRVATFWSKAGGFHLEAAHENRDRLLRAGVAAPEWSDVDRGQRPGSHPDDEFLRFPRMGWQSLAATGIDAPACGRFVKSTSSTTEKWLRKLYVYSNNINMSDEDNNHDTNYINKFHDANHDARKLHE